MWTRSWLAKWQHRGDALDIPLHFLQIPWRQNAQRDKEARSVTAVTPAARTVR
jgi:hypothetical protein